MKRLSVVTSIFNRYWQFEQTFLKNASEIFNHDQVDFVIVDFNGEDSRDIQELIVSQGSKYLNFGSLRYYKKKIGWDKFDMSAAKNICATLSTGNTILFLDADNFIDEEDINASLAINPQEVLHLSNGASAMRHEMWSEFSLFEKVHNSELIWDGTSGRIAVTRKLFLTMGGYRSDFKGMGMEEIDFLARCIKAGKKYIHQSERNDLHKQRHFISNVSEQSEFKHDNNELNYEMMRQGLSQNKFYKTLKIPAAKSDFVEINKAPFPINSMNSRIDDINDTVGILVVCFKIDKWLDRLVDQHRLFKNDKRLVWVFVTFEDPSLTSEKVKQVILSLEDDSMNFAEISLPYDPGLYAIWTNIFRSIPTKYVTNFNPDDLRPPAYFDRAVTTLNKSNDIKIVTFDSVELTDEKIVTFEEATKKVSPNSSWFLGFRNSYLEQSSFYKIAGSSISCFNLINSCPVWDRALIDSVNYFDYRMNGVFGDFEFWMKCIDNGARTFMVEEFIYFQTSPEQLHRSQKKSEFPITRGFLKRVPNSLDSSLRQNLFNMSLFTGSCGAHHLHGWDYVMREFNSLLGGSSSSGCLLDPFVERTLFWGYSQNKIFHASTLTNSLSGWFGFIHVTPTNDPNHNKPWLNFNFLLVSDEFRSVLQNCRGLLFLSKNSMNRFSSCYPNIPVTHVRHPSFVELVSSDNCIQEFSLCRTPVFYHVGIHLRNFAFFISIVEALNLWDRAKICVPPINNKQEFLQRVIIPSMRKENLNVCIEKVEKLLVSLDQEAYVKALKNDIIFNYYMDAGGSNLVSEALAYDSLYITNRTAEIENIFGSEYPLFYDTREEAMALCNTLLFDMKGRHAFKSAVVSSHANLKPSFTVESLVNSLVDFTIKKGL